MDLKSVRIPASNRLAWQKNLSQSGIPPIFKQDLITNPKFKHVSTGARLLYGMLLAELDTKKDIGLIERIKQGRGNPTKIYVKRLTTRTVPPKPALPRQSLSRPFQRSIFPTCRSRKFRLQEVEKNDFQKSKKTDPNHT